VTLRKLLYKLVLVVSVLSDEVLRFSCLALKSAVEVDGHERRLALLILLLEIFVTLFEVLDHLLGVRLVLALVNTLLLSCVEN